MGKNSQEQSSAPKGTSSIHGRTETDYRFEMNDIFRQHTLSERMADANGRNPGYGQSCHRAGLSLFGLWFLSVRVRGTIKPYDPVTTERADILRRNEMA
jgi:hypothetical protein